MPKLNFVFWGTPEVASETLEILKVNGYLPSLIITAPDARAGRGMQVRESPVAIFAKENNIPCLKPEKLSREEISKALKEPADFFVVVAYGKILPEEILNLPKFGSINVHYSLLPKYRGASPTETAILNGETETGVTIQKMVFKMDAGPIISQEKTEIFPDEKTPELRSRLIKMGGEMLVKVLKEKNWKENPQDKSRATFCKKIKKEDGLMDLSGDPVKNYNQFRAYAEWPRSYFFKDGKRFIITDAVLSDSQFIIKKVIPEGKKETNWEDFKR